MLYRLGIFFAVAAMVWVIYDILVYQKRMKDLQKILWIAGAIVFSLLTAILYFIFIKKGKF
ncbi:MAG: PLDc N-terminal domain-containing protein [Leptospiraceae bacterium]|nr:PLDc N-terminal domain-containing protein [Leptospiraceae bacterium]